MKKYKKAWLSLCFYIAAIIWFIAVIAIADSLMGISQSVPAVLSHISNLLFLGIFFSLILINIICGLKSNKANESSWVGNLLAAIGIVTLLGYFLLASGFMGY